MAGWKDALQAVTTTLGVRANAVLLGVQPPPRLPVQAMGLDFPNPLGLAAGFDRTGVLVKALAAAGFGFVEVGTVTPDGGPQVPMDKECPVGVNIGSRCEDLNGRAIDDYAAALRGHWNHADYLTANLTAPAVERDAAGVDRLLGRLKDEQAARTAATGRRVPLTAKMHAGDDRTPLPATLHAARANGLDGIVLVSSSPNRLAAVSAALDPMPIISVGGVCGGWDVQERLAAGAALVQVYTAFVRGGARFPRQLLLSIGAAEVAA